jgi:hypothetical protein
VKIEAKIRYGRNEEGRLKKNKNNQNLLNPCKNDPFGASMQNGQHF